MNKGINASVVAPSDTAYLPKHGMIRYGGSTAANINVLPLDAENTDTAANGVVFTNVQPGEVLPVLVKKVFNTSTAAAAGTITVIS